MKPLVVGFYTVDTPYQHEAETLKCSLMPHGYKWDIVGVPNLGSWQKNTQYKAKFLKSMLEKYPGQRLLYLDVDAIMVFPPVILDTIQCDVAAVHYARTKELLSGTLYLGGTDGCRRLIRQWIHLNEKHPEKLPDGREAWDQRTLEMAIKKEKVQFQELPQGYTYITELTPRYDRGLKPVILHTRGAKRFKNLIDRKPGYAN